MADNSKDSRERADARFKKVQKGEAARSAILADQASEERQRKAKTEKLRELRMARDEALAADAAANPAPAKKPARKKVAG